MPRRMSKDELHLLDGLIPLAVEHANHAASRLPKKSQAELDRYWALWSASFHAHMDEMANNMGLRRSVWLLARGLVPDVELAPAPGLTASL